MYNAAELDNKYKAIKHFKHTAHEHHKYNALKVSDKTKALYSVTNAVPLNFITN